MQNELQAACGTACVLGTAVHDVHPAVPPCTGLWRYEQLDAGHWIPRDRPQELAALLLGFFATPTAQPLAKL